MPALKWELLSEVSQEVSREAANKKSFLFLDSYPALKQGWEPAGWGEPFLWIWSWGLGRLAGLACIESWLGPSPSKLGFPFDFKNSIWSQSSKLEASCVKTVWGETWTRAWLWVRMWLVEMKPAGEGEKAKRFGLGIRLFFSALAARGMLGVENYWKAEFFWQRDASLLTTPRCKEDLAPKVILCRGTLSQRLVSGEKNKGKGKKNSQQKTLRKSKSWLMLHSKLWESVVTIARCCTRRAAGTEIQVTLQTPWPGCWGLGEKPCHQMQK